MGIVHNPVELFVFNLNDISKDHPELMLDICEHWYGVTNQTDWMVKHACGGLLKAGNERALRKSTLYV
ncbi:MAG: hypothetical protein Fur0044_01080 [Anaerolineae bacterium]